MYILFLCFTGLINAAAMFGFPEVLQACWDFGIGCSARDDNLQDLLEAADRYSQNKITTDLLKTVDISIFSNYLA